MVHIAAEYFQTDEHRLGLYLDERRIAGVVCAIASVAELRCPAAGVRVAASVVATVVVERSAEIAGVTVAGMAAVELAAAGLAAAGAAESAESAVAAVAAVTEAGAAGAAVDKDSVVEVAAAAAAGAGAETAAAGTGAVVAVAAVAAVAADIVAVGAAAAAEVAAVVVVVVVVAAAATLNPVVNEGHRSDSAADLSKAFETAHAEHPHAAVARRRALVVDVRWEEYEIDDRHVVHDPAAYPDQEGHCRLTERTAESPSEKTGAAVAAGAWTARNGI
jgi:hypothetical protein